MKSSKLTSFHDPRAFTGDHVPPWSFSHHYFSALLLFLNRLSFNMFQCYLSTPGIIIFTSSNFFHLHVTHPLPIHYILSTNIWNFTLFIGVWNLTILDLSYSLKIMTILTSIFQVSPHSFTCHFLSQQQLSDTDIISFREEKTEVSGNSIRSPK